MKKATVLAVVIAAFGVFSTEANAQVNSTPATPEQVQQDENKQKITEEELPDAVKQSLKSDNLKEWQVSEVYIVAPDALVADAKPTYEVRFTNAKQEQAIARFDEEGKPLASAE